MNVGVIGSGDVAKTLAAGFAKHGHQVTIGSREPAKLEGWASSQSGISVGDFAQAGTFGDVVVLAVKGSAAEEAVTLAGGLAGKVVIDANNPIDYSRPPINGILHYFTGPNDSLMERLQTAFPEARFVKAFSCVGAPFMVNPGFSARPTMFICGNDDDAKAVVKDILEAFGWDSEDIGKVEGARAIEPLCQLWCAPGFQRNQWTHAFKLLKL